MKRAPLIYDQPDVFIVNPRDQIFFLGTMSITKVNKTIHPVLFFLLLESLCTLFQVVWHSMQDEFIHQYKHFEDLIQRCYPGSMINLEVTINDILSYFSNIAQSH